MRARIRPLFLLPCSLVLLLAAAPPVHSQIHGVAPSVTSFGFGGSNNPTPGVPASVSSLGPNGFGDSRDCCFGPFFFSNFSNRPPVFADRRLHDHHRFPVGLSMPVFVPYAVPYPVYAQAETDDDEAADVDDTYYRSAPKVFDRGPRFRETATDPPPRDPAPKAKAKTPAPPPPPAPETTEAPEPVADQPNTVLIFKDGHKSNVQNYAIVAETLFDFTDGRSHKIPLTELDLPATQKINEDHGIDFHVPAKATQANPKK